MFADRLQEVAQQGQLDSLDRDELFYFASLNAVKDTPKMQNFIEDAHSKNRNLKLSDLLALSNEYLNRSPTVLRRTVAVNVCRNLKPTNKLIKEEEEVAGDTSTSMHYEVSAKVNEQEKRLRKLEEFETHMNGRCWYLNKEIEWLKGIIKGKGLHHDTGQRRGDGGAQTGRGDGVHGCGSLSDGVRQERKPGYTYRAGYNSECENVHATGAAQLEIE